MSTNKREAYINALYFDLATLQEALRENKEHEDERILEKVKMIEQELSNIEIDPEYEPWNQAQKDKEQFEKDHYSDLY